MNFFGGVNRRHLREEADAFVSQFFESGAIENGRLVRALRPAFRIVSVGGETKTVTGGIAFAASRIELHEASGASEKQHQDAGGEGIKRTEMTNLAESCEVADRVDDIVRGFTLRLVDDERAVERGGLWFAGHEMRKRSATTDQRTVLSDSGLAVRQPRLKGEERCIKLRGLADDCDDHVLGGEPFFISLRS